LYIEKLGKLERWASALVGIEPREAIGKRLLMSADQLAERGTALLLFQATVTDLGHTPRH
jgi:hypothetical protein